MEKLLVLLLATALADVSIKKTIGKIRATDQESYNISLKDYFEGNNLDFNVTGFPDGWSNPPHVKDPYDIVEQQKIQYKSPAYLQTTRNQHIPTFTVAGSTYFLTWANNTITMYNFNLGKMSHSWDYQIPCEDSTLDCWVDQVEVQVSSDKMSIDSMFFSIRSVYQYAVNDVATRYDLYHATMNGLAISNVDNTDIWFIRFMDKFKFRVFNNTVFCIGMTNHHNSDPVGNILTIVKGDIAWAVQQNINDYNLIPDDLYITGTVQPVDLCIDTAGRLLIADQKLGLIVFSIDSNALFEKSWYYFYDVGGDITSITLGQLSFDTTALLGAVNGIVEITLGALEAYKIYPSINMFSGNADSYAISSPGQEYAFVNNVWYERTGYHSAFTILDRSEVPYNSTTVAEWGIDYFMPNSTLFSPFAPFCIIPDNEDELLYYYIRSDPDAIRLYTVGIGLKLLQGEIAENANITVTGYEKYNHNNYIQQNVPLELLSTNDFTIVQGSGAQPDANPPDTLYQEFINDVKFDFYVPLNQYFSGANMTFMVTPADIPQEMTLSISGAEKLMLLNEEHVQDFNPEMYSDLFSGQYWIAAVNADKIFMYYDDSSDKLHATNPRYINTTESQVKKITFDEDKMFVFGYRQFMQPDGSLQDTQDFFIAEYTLHWNGVNLTVTEDLFENDPDFPCDIFKFYKGHLVCGDANQVRLYTELADGWFELATLDKTTIGNTGPSFDIADVAFGSREDNLFIYIADRINGTHIIDLSNVNETTNFYPYLPEKIELNEVYALYQDKINLYSFNYDGSISVFYTIEPQSPYLFKKMGPWDHEAPTWTTITDRFAIIDNPKTRYIYDLWSPVYSSLYYSYPMVNPDCKPSAPSRLNWDQQFFYVQCDEYIYRYQIGQTEGTSPPYQPQPTISKLELTIPNPTTLTQSVYLIETNVTASNGVSNSTTTVQFSVYNFGEFVSYNSTNLVEDLFASNGTATYAYDKETDEISLEGFFNGQNVQNYLMINGSYPVFNETNNVQPAYILPKTEITDTAQGSQADEFFAHDVFANGKTNYAFLSSRDNGLMVYSLTGQPRGINSTDMHNATYLTQFDMDDVTGGTETVCKTLQTVTANNSTAALLIGCTYDLPTEIITREGTYIHLQAESSIFLVFYDFVKMTLREMDKTRVSFPTTLMTIERRGSVDDEQIFDVLTTYASAPNNNFGRYQITINLPNGDGDLGFQELVDYESLGLTQLQINAYDMVWNATSQTLITYVADAANGLLILSTPIATDRTSLVAVENWLDGQYAMAVGACAEAGILAVANSYGDVYEFDISKTATPSKNTRSYSRHSSQNQVYHTVGPNIVCSGGKDPEFLAFSLAGESLIARILDRKSNSESSVFVDIPVSVHSDGVDGKVMWLNSNTITAVGSGNPILQSTYVRRQTLTIPKLSEDEFSTLRANNADSPNWYLEIVGSSQNGQDPLKSQKYYLNRIEGEEPHHHHHSSSSDDDDDSVPWWGWFLIALAIVAVIVLGAWFFLRSRRNKEPREASGHTRREAPLLDTEYADIPDDQL